MVIIPSILSHVPQKLFVKLYPKIADIKLTNRNTKKIKTITGILGFSYLYLKIRIEKAVVEIMIKPLNQRDLPTVKGNRVWGDTNKGVISNPDIDNFMIQTRYLSISKKNNGLYYESAKWTSF